MFLIFSVVSRFPLSELLVPRKISINNISLIFDNNSDLFKITLGYYLYGYAKNFDKN